MKRVAITLMLLVAFLFSLTSAAFADTGAASPGQGNGKSWKAGLTTEQLAELKNRPVKDRLKVNGKLLKYDVPPVIKEGRTLIPVRAITNGLGAEVAWDAATKTITITRDDVTVVMVLGQMKLLVNGVEVVLDYPASLISNRTFVPLRFIAQALGDKVNYDPDTGDIDIAMQLATPIRPTLTANIVAWTAVANENNGYSLRLFRNGEAVTTVTVAHGAALTYDFTSLMNVTGSYTVKVKALGTGDYSDSKESPASLPQLITITLPVPAAPTQSVVDDVYNTFGWTYVPDFANIAQYEYSVNSGTNWQACTANPQPVGNNAYAAGVVQVRVKADATLGRPSGLVLVSTAPFTAVTVGVPAAPTLPVVDDVANTFGWTYAVGYAELAQYEYTVNSGTTWQACTANPQPLGNNSYAAGAVQVRVKADATLVRPAGLVLVNNVPFTTTTTVSGSVIALSTTAGGEQRVSIMYINNGAATSVTYTVLSTTQILINGLAAQFAGIQLNDAAVATLQDNVLTKLVLTR